MEVTKERNGSITDSKGYRWLYEIVYGGFRTGQQMEESEADKIVNSHATLKAESGLLREFETEGLPVMKEIASMAGKDWLEGQLRLIEVIDTFESKAKALKGK